jgi:polysaccharide biosynthesis protein PslJ
VSTLLGGGLRTRDRLGAGGPVPERSGVTAPDDRGPRLPVTWPLLVLFVAFPVWWLLGVSAFIWPVVAVPMLAVLIWRRQSRAPVAVIFWLAFVSWVLLSGLQLESTTKIITFSYRLALYAAAGILFLYVYNLPRSSRLDTRVLRILTIFWMVVVAGGYAGILLRSYTFVPPFMDLLPLDLRSQPLVQELIQPVFANVERFLGYPVPRPSAPFTYTNNWGGNIAVLTPVAFAAAAAAGPGLRRRLIIAVLVASLVPMAFSLNRGMFLSLGVGIVYVAMRMAIRGRVGALVSLLALTALIVAVVALTPLGHLLMSGLSGSHGHSNATRASLYQQAIAGANASPWFGHGAPQPVTGTVLAGTPAIGTQGQLWMVLYSNGYPATVFFLCFFLAVFWQTRRARGIGGLWLHAVVVIAMVQVAVYGYLPVELQVMMVIAALAYRRCWRPATVSRPRGLPAGTAAQPGDGGAAGPTRALPAAS